MNEWWIMDREGYIAKSRCYSEYLAMYDENIQRKYLQNFRTIVLSKANTHHRTKSRISIFLVYDGFSALFPSPITRKESATSHDLYIDRILHDPGDP